MKISRCSGEQTVVARGFWESVGGHLKVMCPPGDPYVVNTSSLSS